jgi:hypothetical protein
MVRDVEEDLDFPTAAYGAAQAPGQEVEGHPLVPTSVFLPSSAPKILIPWLL